MTTFTLSSQTSAISGVLASSLQGEREDGVGCGELSEERGCGKGANGSREGGSRGFWGFIPSGWSRCTVHLIGNDWLAWVVRWGQHGDLSPSTQATLSVAGCIHGNGVGFSSRAEFLCHGQGG
jgi:hypothetical protein